MQDFVNDEWDELHPAGLEGHAHHVGHWRVAQDFPNLPAWIVKSVGGSTVHWAGASLRFHEHEFKTKTIYGDIAGANLLDWPITLAELEPWYAKAEDKMGTTRTNGIPGLPGNNNFKVMEAGARKLGYKEVPHRPDVDQQPAARRRAAPASRSASASRAASPGAKWSTLYTEIPKGEATGNLEVRPEQHGGADRARRRRQGRRRASMSTRTASSRRRRPASWRSPAIRSKARACC